MACPQGHGRKERERGYMVCSGRYAALETWILKGKFLIEPRLAGHHPRRGPPLKGIAYTHAVFPRYQCWFCFDLRDNSAAISVGGDYNMQMSFPLGLLHDDDDDGAGAEPCPIISLSMLIHGVNRLRRPEAIPSPIPRSLRDSSADLSAAHIITGRGQTA